MPKTNEELERDHQELRAFVVEAFETMDQQLKEQQRLIHQLIAVIGKLPNDGAGK